MNNETMKTEKDYDKNNAPITFNVVSRNENVTMSSGFESIDDATDFMINAYCGYYNDCKITETNNFILVTKSKAIDLLSSVEESLYTYLKIGKNTLNKVSAQFAKDHLYRAEELTANTTVLLWFFGIAEAVKGDIKENKPTCRKCGGETTKSKGLVNTHNIGTDDPTKEFKTEFKDCEKCSNCGHSFTLPTNDSKSNQIKENHLNRILRDLNELIGCYVPELGLEADLSIDYNHLKPYRIDIYYNDTGNSAEKCAEHVAEMAYVYSNKELDKMLDVNVFQNRQDA